jgi:hypothetical protein
VKVFTACTLFTVITPIQQNCIVMGRGLGHCPLLSPSNIGQTELDETKVKCSNKAMLVLDRKGKAIAPVSKPQLCYLIFALSDSYLI